MNKKGDGIAEGCGCVLDGGAARSGAAAGGGATATGGGVRGGGAARRCEAVAQTGGGASGGRRTRRRRRGGSAGELTSESAAKYLLDRGVFFHRIVEKPKWSKERSKGYFVFRLMEKHEIEPVRVERRGYQLCYFWRVADLERVVREELACQ
ncbi:MAG: hypothetical protein LUD39_07005, partial [Opitutae bacterium]|nr:hypothetical protein [Opitutae bacterium]